MAWKWVQNAVKDVGNAVEKAGGAVVHAGKDAGDAVGYAVKDVVHAAEDVLHVAEKVVEEVGGFLSNEVRRSDLNPGDHIYVWRIGYTFAHHGIYIGGDRVIDFTNAESRNGCKNFCQCGVKKHKYHNVVTTCLDCFLKGDTSVYRFRYGVDLGFARTRIRPGTCTVRASHPSDVVVRRAKYLLEIGFGDYHLLNNNCEGFAYYCKTELVVVPLYEPWSKLTRYNTRSISGQIAGGPSLLGGITEVIIENSPCKIISIDPNELVRIFHV